MEEKVRSGHPVRAAGLDVQGAACDNRARGPGQLTTHHGGLVQIQPVRFTLVLRGSTPLSPHTHQEGLSSLSLTLQLVVEWRTEGVPAHEYDIPLDLR